MTILFFVFISWTIIKKKQIGRHHTNYLSGGPNLTPPPQMSRIIQYKTLRVYFLSYYLYKIILHYKAKKRKTKQIVISAHPGIDPGPLVQKSDTLTTKPDLKSYAARNNRAYWTDNPSIGHIRIGIQGKNFEIVYIVDVACMRGSRKFCQRGSNFDTFFKRWKRSHIALKWWWPNKECWLGSFVIFQGFRTSIAKKPYIFVIFQGGAGLETVLIRIR